MSARYFIDALTCTGELFLVPVERRMDWQAFDVAAEETHDPGPVPAWATPVEELSHLEFADPINAFEGDQS